MYATLRRFAPILIVIAIIALVAGCGPRRGGRVVGQVMEECPASVEEVRQAQTEDASKKAELKELESERAQLQAEIRGKKAILENPDRQPDVLRAELEDLRKGSGR